MIRASGWEVGQLQTIRKLLCCTHACTLALLTWPDLKGNCYILRMLDCAMFWSGLYSVPVSVTGTQQCPAGEACTCKTFPVPTCVKDSSYSLLLEATSCSADTAGNALCMLSPSTHAGRCLGCCCSCWCWCRVAVLLACCQKGSPGPIHSVLNCVARAWCHAVHVDRSLALLAGQQCWLMVCRQEQCSRGLQARVRNQL